MTTSLVCTDAIHTAIKADDAAWTRLVLLGVQHIEADDSGPSEDLELRNCTCHSTLCRPVKR